MPLPFPDAQPYEATVTSNRDPEGLGRVKLRIEDELEPESGWIYPMAMGGGAPQSGTIEPPPEGADVIVFFLGGDPYNGRYITGHWAQGEAPTGHGVDDQGRVNRVRQDGATLVEYDERNGTKGIRVKDAQTGGTLVTLEVDVETKQIELKATLGVRVDAPVVDIAPNGGMVTILGRVVVPNGEPI